jgi:4-amino-4-deoxy-L-arabinose transferase-like glycosyltransferase
MLMAFVAIFIVLTVARFGIGITTDSITYIGAAENLVDGEFFVHKIPLATPDHYQEPNYYHEWGPMLPILLAGPLLIGIPQEITAVILNVISYAVLVLLTNMILRNSISDKRLIFAGTVLAVLSFPIYMDATVLMSESLFNLYVLLSLTTLYYHIKNERRYLFVLSIAFASMACLTRYVGVTLLISVTLFILIYKGKLTERFRKAVVLGSL